jgi:hypothetical protein
MAIEMTQLGCTEVVLEPFSAVVVQRHRSLPRIFPPQPCSFSWNNCFIDGTCTHQPTVIGETRLTLDTVEESTRDEDMLLLTGKRNGNGSCM